MIVVREPLAGLLALAPSPTVRGLHARQLAATRGMQRFRAWLAGRRSGKSYAAAVWLLGGKRGEISVYCARTLKSAKGIMIGVFVELNHKYNLGLDIRESTGTITEPNGHVIKLFGLRDRGAADLLRGISKLRRAFVDECFVKGTPVQPVGSVVGSSCRPAPLKLVSVNGITSTPDHPYLTPDGWVRAEDITTETLLCVWGGVRAEQSIHTPGDLLFGVSEPEGGREHKRGQGEDSASRAGLPGMRHTVHGGLRGDTHRDVFEGLPLCEGLGRSDTERNAKAHASAFCKGLDAEGKRNSRAASELRRKVLGDNEAYWAQAEAQRRQFPWRYVAGIPARECHWLADACGSEDGARAQPRAEPLGIGHRVCIEEAGNRGGRSEPLDAERQSQGRSQSGLARWQRVDSVEVHERGGIGRYDEVCPDGLVYNLTTTGGVYLAGGHLVSNCGAFTDDLLKYSVESVLQPMLLDLQGSMAVAGTPGPIPKGYFYDLSGNPGLTSGAVIGRWKTHHWTYEDNPHVPGDLVLTEALEANGWTPQHATFMREYGAIWCEDLDAIIYRYKTLFDGNGKPIWAAPPAAGVTVMTLDFGTVDQTAFAVGRQPYDQRPHLWVLDAFAASNMSLPAIAAKARELRQKHSVNKIYADEGAQGKALAKNLKEQHNIPIEPVSKPHKRAKIDVVRGRLDSETLHLCEPAAAVYDEWLTLCFDELREDHHPRQMDDLSDAVCYLCWAPEFSSYTIPVTAKPPIDLMSEMKRRASLKAMRGNGLGNI